MSYYKTCPCCGAHLDPEEICECKERAAQGATNTQGGKAEQMKPFVPAPSTGSTGNCGHYTTLPPRHTRRK